MKKQNTVKNKGCLFFLLAEIYQLSEYYTMLAGKIFFSRIWGGNCLLLPHPPPMPM